MASLFASGDTAQGMTWPRLNCFPAETPLKAWHILYRLNFSHFPPESPLKAWHSLPKRRSRTPSSWHRSNDFTRQRLHHTHILWLAPLPLELKNLQPTTATIVGSRFHHHSVTISGQVPVEFSFQKETYATYCNKPCNYVLYIIYVYLSITQKWQIDVRSIHTPQKTKVLITFIWLQKHMHPKHKDQPGIMSTFSCWM